MIIKRKHQMDKAPARRQEPDPLLGDFMDAEPQVEWTEEAVERGELPERRTRHISTPDERRRGYRRVEDKSLISKASDEANAIRENAYREGYEAGLAAGQSVIGELETVITDFMNTREDGLMSTADEIASIAITVAEKIIKTEVACDSTLVLGLVRETIQKAGKQNRTIIVKVNPDDAALVKTSLKEEPIPHLKAELIIMDDPLVDSGSCIVETNSGLVDASFSTQLEILRQLFGEVR